MQRLTFLGDRVQFEKDCIHVQATMQDFLAWTNRNIDQNNANPLKHVCPEQYFAYADYMHLPEILDDGQDPLIKVIHLEQSLIMNEHYLSR